MAHLHARLNEYILDCFEDVQDELTSDGSMSKQAFEEWLGLTFILFLDENPPSKADDPLGDYVTGTGEEAVYDFVELMNCTNSFLQKEFKSNAFNNMIDPWDVIDKYFMYYVHVALDFEGLTELLEAEFDENGHLIKYVNSEVHYSLSNFRFKKRFMRSSL